MPPSATKSKTVRLTEFQLKTLGKKFPATAKASAAASHPSEVELIERQLKVLKHEERNEKARLRMAKVLIITNSRRKRAELKAKSPQEQEAYAEKARAYRAKYRETLFIEKYGQLELWYKCARLEKRKQREIKAGVQDPSPIDEEALYEDSDFDGLDCFNQLDARNLGARARFPNRRLEIATELEGYQTHLNWVATLRHSAKQASLARWCSQSGDECLQFQMDV
ncbi:hypothetical protein FB451DRAFT_1171995 [Mycena latifolia]|nr:hypothetical protein FB451DRAFT_1171995 [Mycena latifolia]